MNIRCALLIGAIAVTPAHAAEAPQIEVEEFQLENGMRWLLFERHESPTLYLGWVAHVGSVNERPGITGISHLFEHMMFKGTHTIGTRDIEQDLALIDEQEALRAEMREEESKLRERLRRGEIDDITAPESQSERYRELKARFDELVQKQRETMIKNELDEIYTRNGGEGLNAFTSEDMTAYFVQLPSNRLELWCWLESDRLMNPVFREFYSERDVVYEERRRSVESTPLGKHDEAFSAVFWEAMPYSWPVVGWPSDLAAITKQQADAYYDLFYAPQNLTGVIVGDFELAEARAQIERYFGRIPRGERPPPEMVTLEPEQKGEKRFLAEAETSPTLRIWWHGVPHVHRDRAALDLLTDILSFRTGRLYKGLVQGREIANEAGASVDLMKYAGKVQIQATIKEGVDPATVEAAIDEELERLKREPVGERELQKVKNQAKANAYRRLSSGFYIALQLMMYDGLGDWRYINNRAQELDAVTPEDLMRVAGTYLKPEQRTVGVFLRAQGAAPEDPELAALPEQAKPMARQALSQVESATDPAQLQQMVAQLEGALAGVPPEIKPALELVLSRARARLEELQGEGEEE
jgi:predicted Zn-dependent peptidase